MHFKFEPAKINEAYHILSNENKRRDYDRIIFDLDKAAISREENPGDYRTAERCSEQGLRLSISEYVELIAAVADKHEALYNAKINPRKSIRDQAAVSVIVVLVCIFVLVAKGKNGDHDRGNTRYSGAQSVGAAKSEDGGGFNFSGKINEPAISSVSSDDVSILRSENISEVTERSDETPVSQGGGPLLAGSSDSSIRHYVIAASNLGLRASPGDESPVVRVVPQGKSVLHMGKFVLLGGVRWANVATGLNNEVMGWVNEGLLVPAERPNIKQNSMSGLNGSAMLDEGKAAIGRRFQV